MIYLVLQLTERGAEAIFADADKDRRDAALRRLRAAYRGVRAVTFEPDEIQVGTAAVVEYLVREASEAA